MAIKQILPNSGLAKYAGEWVVLCKKEIIAHNKDVAKLKKKINTCKTIPTIAKIPEKEILIF